MNFNIDAACAGHPQAMRELAELRARADQCGSGPGCLYKDALIDSLRADARRIDWLSDPKQNIGNVQLPTECVIAAVGDFRAAIDLAMELANV